MSSASKPGEPPPAPLELAELLALELVDVAEELVAELDELEPDVVELEALELDATELEFELDAPPLPLDDV